MQFYHTFLLDQTSYYCWIKLLWCDVSWRCIHTPRVQFYRMRNVFLSHFSMSHLMRQYIGWGWLSTISEYWSVSDSSTEYPQHTIAITGQSLTISTIPVVIRKVVDGVFSGRQTDDSQLYHAVSVTGYNSHGNIHVFGLLSHTSKTRGWTSTHPVPSSLRFIDHRQLTDQSSSIQS